MIFPLIWKIRLAAGVALFIIYLWLRRQAGRCPS